MAATDVAGERDPVDLHVGRRVRIRRLAVRFSQSELAERIGVTFQQVQKYERGANRISASMLYRIAAALSVGIGEFFDGLPDTRADSPEAPYDPHCATRDAFLASADGTALADAMLAIGPQVRRSLVGLARAVATIGCDGGAVK